MVTEKENEPCWLCAGAGEVKVTTPGGNVATVPCSPCMLSRMEWDLFGAGNGSHGRFEWVPAGEKEALEEYLDTQERGRGYWRKRALNAESDLANAQAPAAVPASLHDAQALINDLGEWLCRDMEKDAVKKGFSTDAALTYAVIRDVAKRVHFYRDNCLTPQQKGPAPAAVPIEEQEADQVAWESDFFICDSCEEEYYLPEDTECCPICGGDEIHL